ncbi:hypothetical protein CTEN210_06821 [Chaetoceros tenuissimus]|uniref:Uncharacterized protein n=1 Tax=Chaetoceros tenuissimus TaxID=426638 RepID=A0AAD3H4R8_9STRA|nr:hypothetical protein CTEN210_06821 [Chaetoceros tenuissimus]
MYCVPEQQLTACAETCGVCSLIVSTPEPTPAPTAAPTPAPTSTPTAAPTAAPTQCKHGDVPTEGYKVTRTVLQNSSNRLDPIKYKRVKAGSKLLAKVTSIATGRLSSYDPGELAGLALDSLFKLDEKIARIHGYALWIHHKFDCCVNGKWRKKKVKAWYKCDEPSGMLGFNIKDDLAFFNATSPKCYPKAYADAKADCKGMKKQKGKRLLH